MSTTQFQFDPTGTATENLITNEIHPLTEANFRDFYYVIPEFSPFYTTNLVVQFKSNTQSQAITLVENLDYNFGLVYYSAIRSIGIPIYGSIVFNPKYNNGIVILQYQTLGGVWVNNSSNLYTALAQIGYNPLIAQYDQVANVPSSFPPIDHNQPINSTMGYDDLVAALNGLSNNMASFQIRYQNDLAVMQQQLQLYIDQQLAKQLNNTTSII